MIFKFPENFFWGCSTSAYQIEGGIYNNEWGDAAGLAVNHFELWEKDLEILKQLNQNAYRFSIEWARVEPEEGQFDEQALNFYKKIISRLKELNIEPFLTCWHFTNPKWFIDKGGWKSKKSVECFTRYIEKLVEWFGDDVKYWIVSNEPIVYFFESFILGYWPPRKFLNIFNGWRVFNNLIRAAIEASKIIHGASDKNLVGQVENINYFHASIFGFFLAPIIKVISWFNERVFRKTVKSIDFLGLNYYFAYDLCLFFKKKKNPKSDLGWNLYPAGLYFVLKNLSKYNKPVYITEHGLADSGDTKRKGYIKESLKSVADAISDGVDVRGYFHWSLIDNFEWAHGFWPRFGLVEVDYKTFERKIRPSARFYSEICKNNSIDI